MATPQPNRKEFRPPAPLTRPASDGVDWSTYVILVLIGLVTLGEGVFAKALHGSIPREMVIFALAIVFWGYLHHHLFQGGRRATSLKILSILVWWFLAHPIGLFATGTVAIFFGSVNLSALPTLEQARTHRIQVRPK